jgi:hypothetical protein
MLSEVASNHGDVLQKPPPAVMFKKLGTTTMDFELICVVGDVEITGRVNSDLNFAIHKRLAEMEPAAAVPELMVRGLEGVEHSLGSIAEAVGQRDGVRSRPKRDAPKPAPAASARRSRKPVVVEEPEEEEAEAAKPAPAPEPAKDDSKE